MDKKGSFDAEGSYEALGSTAEPEPLAMISTYLHNDRNLTSEAANALDEVVKATYARLRSS